MALPAASWSGPKAATAAAATSGVTECFSRCAPVLPLRGPGCRAVMRGSSAGWLVAGIRVGGTKSRLVSDQWCCSWFHRSTTQGGGRGGPQTAAGNGVGRLFRLRLRREESGQDALH